MRECHIHEILELLDSGVIEIGIIRTPLNSEIYDTILLPNEPMIAATNGNLFWKHKQKYINMKVLANKPLLIHRRYEKMVIEACQHAGFEPRILGKIDDTRAILLWADTGMGVSVVVTILGVYGGFKEVEYCKTC